MRKGLLELANDKEFLEDVKRSRLEVGILPGEAVQDCVSKVAATPPDVVARFVGAMSAP